MDLRCKEVNIPVPWGNVAAKAWGDPTKPIVLMFHGLLDNAASFDRLIPHLPQIYHYMCIDLPGHGHSESFDQFFPLQMINYMVVYKVLVEHFKQGKYIIIGHSFGGQIAFLFTQLYQQYVEKLILLDTVHSLPVPVAAFKETVTDRIEFCIKLHQKKIQNPRPAYTYEEALDKLQNFRFNGVLTREAAEPLLKRAVVPAPDSKFYFTADPRLKNFFNPLHDFNYIIRTIRTFPVKIPMLIILGSESEVQQIYMKPILTQYATYDNIKVEHVEGNHDVHNNSPELVAPIISRFLLDLKYKL